MYMNNNNQELLANPEAKADFVACTNNLIRQVDSQQTSNTATLALQGVRTVKGSAMPPMAQVGKSSKGPFKGIQCCFYTGCMRD